MAGRFPGAPDLAAFWRNLTSGTESISDIPLELMAAAEPFRDPDYVPRRGVLDQAEWFDAAFFGMNPKEAEITDPQHRVFLELCWHALEHAGCDPKQAAGSIGVYAGCSNNSWIMDQVLLNRPLRTGAGADAMMTGNEKDYLATRVAFKLDLRGPAINTYTACSTSLVAIIQAVHALQSFQCDIALAGGVSVKWPQERGYLYQEGGILSPDGHCRPFDEKAAGTVFSSGGGAVVLKRAEDAVRDGDFIWAIIRSGALNNDGGSKSSFFAPSAAGHAELISLAHALADVEPDSISYVECHGTATPIGDPIEIAGLTQAFRLGTQRTGFCGIGSVKGNIGHTDAAAGVAGLMKTALALHHRTLPATLHFTRPNPALQLESSPFRVIDRLNEWSASRPRRAGVSSFGVGGTNAHVIVEEAPESHTESGQLTKKRELFVLSARSPDALRARTAQLRDWLGSNPAVSLRDIAWTLQTGRQLMEFRTACTAATLEELSAQLEKCEAVHEAQHDLPAVFVFPGQGSQHLRMGGELFTSEPVFRQALEECADLFLPLLQRDLREILTASVDDEALRQALTRTSLAQPAIFAVEYAMARWLMARGVQPAAMIGHSIGEYAAWVISGVLSLTDAVRLVASRGKLMDAQPSGAMLAVRLAEADVRARLPESLDIAALNAPTLTVVSGPADEMERFSTALEAEGVSARRLHTSHAFHSRMMGDAMEAFRAEVASVTLCPAMIPVTSNVTGQLIAAGETPDRSVFVEHLCQPVRFTENVAAVRSLGPCVMIETGPGAFLTPLVRQQGCLIASLMPEAKAEGAGEHAAVISGMGRYWCHGGKMEWAAWHTEGAESPLPRKIPLPVYPFQRQRFCPDFQLPAGTRRDGESWLLYPEHSAVEAPACAIADESPSSPVASSSLVASETMPQPASASRAERILQELRAQLHKISGIDIADAAPGTPFLDLGFDSLFLTQASLSLRKHFGVKITFRQLMEELTSLQLLANHLEKTLPPDRFAAPVPSPVTSAPVATRSQGEAGGIEARLERIEASLAALTGAPLPAAAPAGASGVRVQVSSQKGSEGGKIAFGPFRQPEKSADGSLTARQREHLDGLITAYTTKYAAARKFTAESRSVFADPRAVAGFHPLWKDMVFPAVTASSEGAILTDTDGNRWIDVVHGFGLGMFGHRPDFVVNAIREQLEKGMEIGPTCPLAAEVAELVCGFSGQDRAAFCNTGSEALMAAIRVSRTITGRDLIVMFAGSYHGIFDEVLARPLVTNGELRSIPIAPGIPESAQANLLVLEYGNPESLEIIRRHSADIAAVLVEPVPSRRPDIFPVEFVQELRRITQAAGTALVFDEVVLGFRSHQRGAQHLFGIRADLVTYGKVIGGGMPFGVICGQKKFMDALDGGAWNYGDASAPETGMTFFAGTFIRHPLTLAAARAVLHRIRDCGPALQEELDAKTAAYVAELQSIFTAAGVPIRVTRFSSMWMLHADPGLKYFALLFYHLRLRGIHFWEGRPGFLSTAHTVEHVQEILQAFRESITALQEGGFFPGAESRTASLTPAQQEMFLQAQLSEDLALSSHESLSIDLTGPLNVAALERSLNTLVARHEALRMKFSPDGRTMTPGVAQAVHLRTEDLSGADDAAKAVRAITDREYLEPFDLQSGALLRVCLIRLGAEQHQLVLTAPHIACDGWSFGVLVHELAALCRGESLPPAPSFCEWADEQMSGMSGEDHASARDFWKAHYATLPEPAALPADGLRPAAVSSTAQMLTHELDGDLLAAIQDACRRHHVTPNVLLLAAWSAVQSRLTGSADVITGIPVAAQITTGQTGLVGHCVQFLPLRLQTGDSVSGAEWLHRVRSGMGDAQEHSGFTLGELLTELPGLTPQERLSFVPVSFSFEPETDAPDFGGVRSAIRMNPKLRLGFDLSLYLFQKSSGIEAVVAWRDTLFSEATVRRWLGHFSTLLRALCANPDQPLRELPLLSAQEQQSFLAAPMPVSAAAPVCLHEWFRKTAAANPARTAVTCAARTLTYAELDARSSRIAGTLRAAGVKRGDIVAMLLERTEHLPVAILAILKAGAAYLPIDPVYPPERAAWMMQDACVKVAVSETGLAATVRPHATQTVLMDEDTGAAVYHGDPDSVPDDAAYVIFTSGSTGRPKGCVVTHANVSRLMTQTEHWFGFGTGDVWTLFHSAAFDFSVWELWGALLYGGRLVVVPWIVSRSPDSFLRLLAEEKVTVLNQTPSAFRQLMLADAEQQPALPLALRYVIFGGEALEMASLKPWFDRRGDVQPRLINMYGITETTVHVTWRALTAADTQRGSVIGQPIPDLQIFILDPDTLQLQPPGVAGEMFVGGAGLARGYLNRPELTTERFLTNPLTGSGRLYRTGDLARWIDTEHGRDIEYLGRIDQQVKIRGFRVELGEIEAELRARPGVRDAAVLAIDTDGEKQLCAWLVSDEAPNAEELRRVLGQKLPAWMVPAHFVRVPALPLTENGKLDRRALPAPQAPGRSAGEEWTPPADPDEQRLAAVWEEVLGRNHIGSATDFFAAGGTSLSGLRLMLKVRSEFNVQLPLGTLFQAPTLGQMAREIRNAATAGISSETADSPAGDEGSVHPGALSAAVTAAQPAPVQSRGREPHPLRHCLVTMQEGPGVPVFLIHGGDGGALFYRNLIPGLGTDHPLHVIESPALTRDEWLLRGQSVEETADAYLSLIRDICPDGPLIIGGYSYGGAVAWDIAQKLEKSGRAPELLVLFDTDNPACPSRKRGLLQRLRARWRMGGDTLTGKLTSLFERLVRGAKSHRAAMEERDAALRMLAAGHCAVDALRPVQIRERNVSAMQTYQPQRLLAPVLLMRSNTVSDSYELAPDRGWSGVAALSILDVPGDHLEMFDPPHVATLADELRQYLASRHAAQQVKREAKHQQLEVVA